MYYNELIKEYQRNVSLAHHIESEYNYLRSHIYLDFIKLFNSFPSEEVYVFGKDDFEKAANMCAAAIDDSYKFYEYNKLDETVHPSENAARCVFNVYKRVLRYFDAYMHLCVICKNHILYLYKKFYQDIDFEIKQTSHFPGEISFKNDEDVEKFESDNCLDVYKSKIKTMREVCKSLQHYIRELDYSFTYIADIASNKTKL